MLRWEIFPSFFSLGLPFFLFFISVYVTCFFFTFSDIDHGVKYSLCVDGVVVLFSLCVCVCVSMWVGVFVSVSVSGSGYVCVCVQYLSVCACLSVFVFVCILKAV